MISQPTRAGLWRALRLFAPASVGFGGLAALVLSLTIAAWPVPINVRWAAGVGDAQRRELERRFSLTEGRHAEGTTFQYQLIDTSTANIRALVEDEHVEDTANLNRVRFRPSLRWDRTRLIVVYSLGIGIAGGLFLLALPWLTSVAARPVIVPRRGLIAVIVALPAALLVAAVVILAMGAAGIDPLWRASPPPSLAQAAYSGDRAMVAQMLAARADPNAAGDVLVDGRVAETMTPLEAAVWSHDLPTVELLVNAGADPWPQGARLICLALDRGAAEIADYLRLRVGSFVTECH